MSVKTGYSVPENFLKLLQATCELPELRWNINPLPILSSPKLRQILMRLLPGDAQTHPIESHLVELREFTCKAIIR